MRQNNTAPRALMELAVEVMRQSIPEHRSDNKVSPKVGAVLLKLDGTVETAYRGELRHGDHAEYTLLERKNRANKLDGAVLFATLEPCAPNARRSPKLGCAERIVLARIKEVWVGIEDPDPTVDRKGIKYLQDMGITVHMFDRDLQEIILEENRDFIAQAQERAVAAVAEKAAEIVLSPLEGMPEATQDEDLSSEALEAYRSNANIEDGIDSLAFRIRLTRQGILQQEGNRFVPTGFGLLLFGKEPRTTLPQVGLLGTIHHPDGTEDIRNFEGPQVLAPQQALEWLRDKLPNPIDRSEAHRRESNSLLFELVREGIVNAIVHRDYDITGGKCQLIVTPDKIVVMSPGMPIKPITLEQMQSFSAPMLSRNPVLHNVFARMKLAEERGLGLTSMKKRAAHAGLPLPRYTWNDPYLVLTLYRSAVGAANDLAQQLPGNLTEEERTGLQFLSTRETVTKREYAEKMGFDAKKAQRHLKRFVELGLVRLVGSGPSSAYELRKP